MDNTTEFLSVSEMDDCVEVQMNLDPCELPAAIDALSTDQLTVLREMCEESVDRQIGIIHRVDRRLAGN